MTSHESPATPANRRSKAKNDSLTAGGASEYPPNSVSPARGTKQAKGKKRSKRTADASVDSSHQRQRMIAEAAYYKAERRGFQQGAALLDWLEAEREVDRTMPA